MKILIVYVHPLRTLSYTSGILEQLITEIEKRTWTVEISDLYAQDFQSELTVEEYHREALSHLELPTPPDVAAEHEKLERAEAVVFLYPVWWSDCPARLKGWFDRVWTVGYAYKHTEKISKMKTVAYGAAICTAGYSNEELLRQGIAQSMERIMINDRLGNRFTNKQMVILGGTLEPDQVRSKHHQQIVALLETFRK